MKSITVNNPLALQLGGWVRDGKLKFSKHVLAVRDIADASDKWEAIREAEGYSGSDAPIVVVVDTLTGEQVAKISYNGRAWAADGSEIPLPGYKTAAQQFPRDHQPNHFRQ